ncbi:ATP/GTP-binding protein [Streptomyces niveus]|uniref:ATP/GTP-binding protein n=1 Tax=Streptomyces niveus TaxID=193462 RepID=UPI0035DED900
MLTRRHARTVAFLTALATFTLPAQARADDDPQTGVEGCGMFVCAEAGTPGSGGGKPDQSGGTGGSGGAEQTGDSGSDKPSRTCTYKKLDPQPPEGSFMWEGHAPDEGAVYVERCVTDGDPNSGVIQTLWSAEEPEAQIDPAVLAQQAVDKMLLRGPEIGITPKPGGKGVVGMPVYLWTERGAETYGPNTATASAGGVTVIATAKVSRIVWAMGDGKTVTCTTAGTPYKPSFGKKPSPDCGHRYNSPSSTEASGKFHVTATSTWTIDWTGGGQSGQLIETRDGAVDITVAEVQVLS